MIVPNKIYEVVVKFDDQIGRWVARFSAIRFPNIAYEFPLADHGPYNKSYPQNVVTRVLDNEEEALLAMTFNKMITETVASALRHQAQQQLQAPESQAAQALQE